MQYAKVRVLKSYSVHVLEEGQCSAMSVTSDTNHHLRDKITRQILWSLCTRFRDVV